MIPRILSRSPARWALGCAGALSLGGAGACAAPCAPRVVDGVALSDQVCAPELRVPAPTVAAQDGLPVLGAWPADAAGRPAPGAHPIVIFAHASQKSGCKVYDRYKALQAAWARAGAVVLSVGAGRRACGKMSAESLELRAEGLRAARSAAEAGARGEGPLAPLAGAINPQQVWYAGHSRGGGAALLAAAADEAEGRPVTGVIALQPTPPRRWGLLAPTRAPALVLLAGADTDVTPALTRSVLDETVGPIEVVTLPGAVHAWTGDDLPLRAGDAPGTDAATQRAWTEALTAAALRGEPGAPWVRADGLPRVWARWPGQVALGVEGARAGLPWGSARPQDPDGGWWELPVTEPGARLAGPRGAGGQLDLRVVGPPGAALRADPGGERRLGPAAATPQGEQLSLPGDADRIVADRPGVWVQAVAWRPG